MLFWEFYQQSQIQSAKNAAGRAEQKAETSRQYIQLLEDKIASLALACQSLWEVLEDKTDITQQDLLAKMEEVDLRDGRKDGKLSRAVDACPNCGRKSSRRRPRCMYCGTEMGSSELFGRH
jgi:rRNA maturation endonuclease Nob1